MHKMDYCAAVKEKGGENGEKWRKNLIHMNK